MHGALSQVLSALTHRVPKEELARIDSEIPRIKILTGTKDNLVSTRHSYFMKSHMPHAEFEVWEDGGHALHVQDPERYSKMLHAWLGQ